MVALPENTTVAALALVLGLAIGVGGTYYFMSSEPKSELAKLGDMEGKSVLERIREIAPRDTSGQEEADVEIRYKTKRDTVYEDTLRVPVPENLASRARISDRSPIAVTEDRVKWTYWNPTELRYEQKLYAVPQDRFKLSVHALARAHAPLRAPSLSVDRTWAGVGLSLRYRRLEASVSALTSAGFERQRLTFGLRWRLW